MLDSLDCTHWKWKQLRNILGEQYVDHRGSPTIMLEVLSDYDLWIWYEYFDLQRSSSDINVLESYHLFPNLAE